ncbi:phosphotransferase enzyme family protein [Acinetobacter sp.]|uniref:phosphotransferase enzyme family protein n=2 Tax=Acinetobacter sp. TaxID=472 RepID=UPI002FC63DB8
MAEQRASLGHGMGESLEPKDWQDISAADLAQLQQRYPQLQGQAAVLWRSPRPFSSAMLIQVNQAAYFIKRSHRSFRTAADLKQEHQLIQHLAEQRLPLPKIICSKDGATAVELDDWSYEVHEKAHGLDLYADHLSWKPFFCAGHACQAGQMLAALHKAAENYPVVQGRSAQQLISNQDLLLSHDIAQAIRQRIKNSSALSAYFAEKPLDQAWLSQLAHVHEKVKTAMQCAPKIWTHNDLHASNLLWSKNSDQAEISTVIDFGLTDRNSAIYDLAVTVERNFIDWLALNQTQDIHIDEAGLQAFIQAYVKHAHPLEELAILPELIKIVHTDFAVSELEYFAGITRNFKHADAAYHDWLIAHTDWFFKPQGQQFCQKLAQLIQQAAA